MLLCQYCNRAFKNSGSKATHEPYCKINPDRVQRTKSPLAHKKKGTPGWSKGLTKETDPRIKPSKNKGVKGLTTGKASTPEKEIERIRKITEKAKQNNGGLRQGSGRGKKGWYRGFFCDSSWELAYLIFHLDHNIHIERCKEVRYYEWENSQKKYYPDFITENKIVEIKGYKSKQWEAKLKANPDVTVLYGKDMKVYLEYTINKYGKDYINLYSEDRVAGQQSVLICINKQ